MNTYDIRDNNMEFSRYSDRDLNKFIEQIQSELYIRQLSRKKKTLKIEYGVFQETYLKRLHMKLSPYSIFMKQANHKLFKKYITEFEEFISTHRIISSRYEKIRLLKYILNISIDEILRVKNTNFQIPTNFSYFLSLGFSYFISVFNSKFPDYLNTGAVEHVLDRILAI